MTKSSKPQISSVNLISSSMPFQGSISLWFKRESCCYQENRFEFGQERALLAFLNWKYKLSDWGRLLGHCSENWNEKYFVYNCMANRDLSCSFYSRVIYLEGVFQCNWIDRLIIARGLAEALSFLRHQCVPPLVRRWYDSKRIR